MILLRRQLNNHASCLLLNLLEVANHVECAFWEVIMLTVDDTLESTNCFFKGDKLALSASEHLSDMERLRHELLHLTRTGNCQFIILRELVHTKDGDNVLQTLVVLKDLLGGTGNLVVVVTNDTGVKHTGCGVKRVDSGVNSKLSDRTGKHCGCIQVSEGGGRSRIGKVISRHVDSLHRGNGSLGGRSNTLLEATHVCGKGWLVSYSRRNTAKKGRHLRTSLCEAEDVVNEKEHVLALLITEVLSNGKTSKSNTGAGTWGLVHLTVHKGSL
mmetsp:Transcript_41840/g.126881  ORF Transcript_41840/g.126881 Transcript_41840/m.126881 type:complete len:271 (+) Transcript_41840:322-1134(+)